MTTPMVLDDAALYGLSDVDCEFCLVTHKPGPCARPHVQVPDAPAPKTMEQVAQEHSTDQNYLDAMGHAEQLAQQLGADPRHAKVAAAIQDYARAHSLHQHAVIASDLARQHAQQAHDTAVAKNQAIDKANAAAQAAAQARQALQQKRAALHAAAKAHQKATAHHRAPAHHSLDSDLYGQLHVDTLYAVDSIEVPGWEGATGPFPAQYAKPHVYARDVHSGAGNCVCGMPLLDRRHVQAAPGVPMPPGEYALYGLPEMDELYAVVSSAHWWCAIGEFCRNPLHPGPCKGWKHMLHQVAPGAYHAYEKQRVAKLNEKRKAKIAELEAAGKKVPAYLKKEITYQQVPVKPEGVNFEAPTPKEAISKLPATAKEIGAKIAMKHEAIAKAKAEKQAAALVNIIAAHSPLSKAQHAVMNKKVADAIASLKPGEKPSDVPLVANTLKLAADKLAAGAKLDGPQHAELLDAMKEHVDQGIPELPLLHVSATNHAEKLKKDAADAAEAKAIAQKAVTKQKLKYLLAHNYATYWRKASQADRDAAITSLKEAISSGHLELGDKLKANAMIATISEVSAQEAKKSSIPGVTGELKKTGQMLGTHGAQVAVDEAGKKFLAKPHASYGDFTSHGEVGASQLAKAAGLPTPEVHLTKDGTVQEMVPGAKDAFPGKNFDPSKLSDKDILDIQKHHVLDWLIGNHDAHPGNFLRDEHGNLVEIDKGQAFKHFHEDKLSANYHPNAAYGEQEPVYNTLLKAASAGKVKLNDPKTGELHDFIQKVQNLPDTQVKDMFRPYAEAAAKAGQLPGAPNGGKTSSGAVSTVAVDTFLDNLIKRKKTLGSAFTYLHSKHTPVVSKIAEPTPKVTGPIAHPDMMHALDVVKNGTPAELVKAMNAPGVNATEWKKLPAKTGADVMIKLAQAHAADPKGAETAAENVGVPGEMVKALASEWTMKKSGTPAATAPANLPVHVKHAQSLATGATYGTSKAKLAAYDKLSQEEYHSLPGHIQAVIRADLLTAHDKFLDPKKKAQVKAVMDKLGPVKAPGGAGAPHHEPAAPVHAPEPGTTHVQNQAKAYQAIAKLSGTTSGISKNTQLLEKFFTDAKGDKPVIAPALNHMLSDWSQKHLDGLPLTPEEKNAITEKARAEMLQMVMGGTVTPPGGGVLHVSEAAGPHSPETVAAVMKGAAGIPVKSAVNPPQSGAGGPAKVPTKVASAKAPGLGKGTSTAKISAAAKDALLAAYKGQPGTYIANTSDLNYQAILNVAHAHTGKKGFGTLSLSQVIDSIDEAQAKKLGVSNTGMLKKKITDWLATPEGKAAAQALTPNEAQVKALQSGIVEPVKLPKGEKVPKLGGPGPFDKNAKATDFKALTHGEILKIQKDYQEQAGTHWTPAQLSAIKTYTSSSDNINGYLRGEHAGYGDVAQQAVHLQQAMMPIQEDVKLNRGTGWEFVPPQYRSYEGMQKLIGKTISDKAFLSTATAGESQGFGSKDVQIQIEAPKGTMGIYVEHVTSITTEYEVILAAGTKLKVTGVSKNGYKTVVKARVVS